jgi:hypothetical protein
VRSVDEGCKVQVSGNEPQNGGEFPLPVSNAKK